MNISFPRGDYYTQEIELYDTDETSCEIEFDDIYFTVKYLCSDKNYVIQKRYSKGEIINLGDGRYQFEILPEDTDNLKCGKYIFDIEVVSLKNKIKQTVLGTLTLTREVTFAENEV